MKKIIRLTESDLTRIVKRTIMEMDRRDNFKNYSEGPFSMGNANYEKNWEKHNEEMRQQAEKRKFSVPPYDPSSGSGWNDGTLRSCIDLRCRIGRMCIGRQTISRPNRWT